MNYGNNEKFNMLECYIRCNYNEDAASQDYLNSFPERSQPHKSIFERLKNNLIEHGSFTKKRPKKYNIHDEENSVLSVIGTVSANPNISSRQIEEETGIARKRALDI